LTFSIAALNPATGQLGLAIASSSPAVAARCAHARAGVGAVATQNITDPSLGPALLDLMALGLDADAALTALGQRPNLEYRQLIAIDRQGRTGAFSGARTLGCHASAAGENAVAAGNLLAGKDVPLAMVRAFTAASGSLGDRLLAALKAGLAAGGEAGPVHSAGLLLVDHVPWPVADLRVDWHETDPVAALDDLWQRYQPQMQAYIDRALDPAAAPGYGVPGER
jgi:uncharacterized Ntn-hydrolase superfamily protein